MRILEVSSFEDLKQKAWQAVRKGRVSGFDQDWENTYIKHYAPCSDFWTYENVIKIYLSYLSNKITEL